MAAQDSTESISAKIDSEVKRKFRMVAAERNQTQSELLREMIEQTVAANFYDRGEFCKGELVWDMDPGIGDTKRLAVVTENPDNTDKSRKVAYIQSIRSTQQKRDGERIWHLRPTGTPRESLVIDRDEMKDDEEGWIQQYPTRIDDLRRIDDLPSGDKHA